MLRPDAPDMTRPQARGASISGGPTRCKNHVWLDQARRRTADGRGTSDLREIASRARDPPPAVRQPKLLLELDGRERRDSVEEQVQGGQTRRFWPREFVQPEREFLAI